LTLVGIHQNPPEASGIGKFREAIYFGEGNFSPADVTEIIMQLSTVYRPDNYDLCQHNCNHFSDAFIYQLLHKRVPDSICRLGKFISHFKGAVDTQNTVLLPDDLNKDIIVSLVIEDDPRKKRRQQESMALWIKAQEDLKKFQEGKWEQEDMETLRQARIALKLSRSETEPETKERPPIKVHKLEEWEESMLSDADSRGSSDQHIQQSSTPPAIHVLPTTTPSTLPTGSSYLLPTLSPDLLEENEIVLLQSAVQREIRLHGRSKSSLGVVSPRTKRKSLKNNNESFEELVAREVSRITLEMESLPEAARDPLLGLASNESQENLAVISEKKSDSDLSGADCMTHVSGESTNYSEVRRYDSDSKILTRSPKQGRTRRSTRKTSTPASPGDSSESLLPGERAERERGTSDNENSTSTPRDRSRSKSSGNSQKSNSRRNSQIMSEKIESITEENENSGNQAVGQSSSSSSGAKRRAKSKRNSQVIMKEERENRQSSQSQQGSPEKEKIELSSPTGELMDDVNINQDGIIDKKERTSPNEKEGGSGGPGSRGSDRGSERDRSESGSSAIRKSKSKHRRIPSQERRESGDETTWGKVKSSIPSHVRSSSGSESPCGGDIREVNYRRSMDSVALNMIVIKPVLDDRIRRGVSEPSQLKGSGSQTPPTVSIIPDDADSPTAKKRVFKAKSPKKSLNSPTNSPT